MHPAAGGLVLRRHLTRDEVAQTFGAHQPLPEHDLAAAVAAEGRAEGRLDPQQRPSALGRPAHLGGVVGAGALDVLLEPPFVGPDRVLHEDRLGVILARRGHGVEVERLER